MLATRTARTFSNLTARHLHLKEKKGGKRFTSPFVLSCDRRFYASQQEQVVGKGVLVTGCDSGFGFSVAKHLHSKGFTVFAGCLLKDKGHDGVKELDDMKCDRMKTVQLNVCKEEEVQSAVERIRANLKDPEKGLLPK